MRNILIVLLVFSLPIASSACSTSSDNESPMPMAKPAMLSTVKQSPEPIVITIGNFTDKTGPASTALSIVDMVLEDMIKYYNEQNLIPGVELKVISYDGQYDPSNDIPGYEWLKESGADLVVSAAASTGVTLKSRLEKDEMVLILMAVSKEAFDPPGNIFCTGNTLWEYASYTLLKWIAENDPDFPTDRPARIGGAVWAEPTGQSILDGAEEYAVAHPQHYEWIGGYLTDFSFIWESEVESLKDCDYVLPPGLMNQFVQQYRQAGHTAKFVGNDLHTSYLGLLDEAGLWAEVDGMLLLRTGVRWWNEEGELIDLTKKLLYENHPDQAEEIIQDGSGYLTTHCVYVMLELIADAVEAVGPKNFNSLAIYDAAQSFSLTIDGIEIDSLNETKRTSLNYFGMYEIRGANEDLFSISDWIPVEYEP